MAGFCNLAQLCTVHSSLKVRVSKDCSQTSTSKSNRQKLIIDEKTENLERRHLERVLSRLRPYIFQRCAVLWTSLNMSGEPVELSKLGEKSQFMNEQKTKDENNQVTCCRSKHTKNCCIATGVFGCIFLVLGKVELLHIMYNYVLHWK